ncbi:MAG TPA: hypothetical protein DCX53_04540 [Anaerolineae bacterium]|nr:hypothetical protein [Anaerolineae bacterium]
MNLDIGEVLSSAFKITWKHKILWVFSTLPMLLSFMIIPIMFVPIIFMDGGSSGNPFFFESQVYSFLFIGFIFFFSLLSYVLYGITSSSVLLGVIRADEGAERLPFRELFNDSKPYWLRVLGVLFLIGLGVFTVFAVIFGCFTLIGAVTMGLGFICLQPLLLLMYPFMLVLYGIIEESQVAVVADGLGVTDAIKRGWDLVRANFWRILLISLIVYFGVSLLSSVVVFPLMMPFFFIPLFMDSGMSNFDPRTMMLFMGGFSLIFFPVMAFVQGIGITFMKSTFTLVYLRLTKPQANAPAVFEKNHDA